MSQESDERQELINRMANALRHATALGTIFGQAIAERVGVNSRDLDTLDLLNVNGPMTAGRLAEVTGLTTGAITGLVDRMEKHGFARRESDPSDRRRVIIAPNHAAMGDVAEYYAPMSAAMVELWSRYTDEELRLILDFTESSGRVMQEAIARLRESTDADDS